MSLERLRWGILGTGMIAKKFATDLPMSNSGILSGTASRTLASAEAFATEFGGRAFEGYDALLADPDIDAVYLSLPNGLHKEWSIKAMQAGKHVLCEKPMSLNAPDAEEMFAVAAETGRTLIEAFMYRAHPQTKKLLEVINSGVLGDLKLIRTNFTFAREALDTDARYHPDQGGGSLMDVGCYCTHFTRMLAGGEPIESTSIAHLHPMGVDDYAAGTMKFENGLLATFTCGMTVVSDQSAHIAGTKGRIEMDRFWFCQDGFTVIQLDGSSEFFEVDESRPIYAIEADAFADAARGEAEPWISPADTIGNMKVMDAMRLSAGVPVPGL